MPDDSESALLFLDSFPNEVLDNVLRYLSRLPSAKNWETHLDLEDLIPLFAVRGDVGTLLKSRFHTLIVCKTKDCYYENKWYGWKLRSEPHLWTDKIHQEFRSIFLSILKHCASSHTSQIRPSSLLRIYG